MTPTEREVGLAIVGSSGHAARVSAPSIAAGAGARLVGVLGSTLAGGERLAQSHSGCRAYGSFEELGSDDAVDGVWVAGPNAQHVEFAKRCLDAGKHVLVEKPLATRHQQALELQAAAEASGLQLKVAFQHRFRPSHEWIRSAIRDGAVGQLRTISIHRFWPFPYYPDMPADYAKSWRTSLEESGGWILNDLATHSIDLAMWLADEHATLAAAQTSNLKFVDVEAEDTVVLVLEAPSGTLMVIEASNAMASFPGTIEVHGLEGWIRAEGTFDGGGSVATHSGTEQGFPEITMDDTYVAELVDFVAAINGGPSHGATAADAAANVAIVEAAAKIHGAKARTP